MAQEKIKHFTFYDKIPDLHHTKPIDFVYLNEKYYVNNWPDFVVQIAKILLDNPFGTRLKTATKTNTGFSKKLCTDKMISNMVSPRQVAKDLWIETAMSATTLAKFAQWMVIWCILPPKAFLIHYQHKDNISTEPKKQELSTSVTVESREEENVKNTEEHESAKVVLPADQSKKHVTDCRRRVTCMSRTGPCG